MGKLALKTKNLNITDLYAFSKDIVEKLPDQSKSDFRLEQVEFNEKENVWNCIISYLVPNKLPSNSNNSLFGNSYISPFERIYKLIKVNEKKELIGFFMYNL